MALVAIALLLANDHLFKMLFPGVLTGKLSDFAGLAFFPLLLLSVLESMPAMRGRDVRAASLVLAIATTGAVFAAVKTLPFATDTFNDLLGIGQWVAGLGPLLGSSPQSTSGVTDPSDLVALPALVVSVFVVRQPHHVGGGPQRRIPSAPVVVGLLVAGIASLATSPAYKSSSTTFTEALVLTPEVTAVTRHLTFEIESRDPITRVRLTARAVPRALEGSPAPLPNMLVTLHADEPRTGIAARSTQPELDLSELCRQTCRHGVSVAVRLRDPAELPDGGLPFGLTVELSASGGGGTGTLDADVTLAADGDRAIDAVHQVRTTSVDGSLRVSAEELYASVDMRLRVDAAALRPPLEFPLLGEISMSVRSARGPAVQSPQQTVITIRPPDSPTGVVGEFRGFNDYTPTTADLFDFCAPDSDCLLDLSLWVVYDPRSGARPSEPVALEADLDWTITIRLEALDGRTLPRDAVRIELTEGSD